MWFNCCKKKISKFFKGISLYHKPNNPDCFQKKLIYNELYVYEPLDYKNLKRERIYLFDKNKLVNKNQLPNDSNFHKENIQQRIINKKENQKQKNKSTINITEKKEEEKKKESILKVYKIGIKNENNLYENENIEEEKKNLNKQPNITVYSKSIAKENPYGQTGLINFGNICYMNSVLQCIKNCYPFTIQIINMQEKGELTMSLKNLLINILSTKKLFSPEKFKNQISKIDPYFLWNSQKDSIYLITTLFDKLQKELNTPIDYKMTDNNSPFEKYKKKLFKRKYSIITEIFGGFFKNTYQCIKCKFKLEKYQLFNLIILPIMDGNMKIPTLKDCFKVFQRKIKHDQLNCDCGEDMTLETKIHIFPKILIINFARTNGSQHINHPVKFPEDLNVNEMISNSKENKIFKLFGIINHEGGSDFGHNFSYCENIFGGQWFEFNDNSVSPVCLKEILKNISGKEFILFYRDSTIQINNKELENIKKIINKEKPTRNEKNSSALQNRFKFNH